MPELPEVEYFRQLLLPLVGTHKLQIEITGSNSKRIQLSNEERKLIAESFCCTDVLRKGKQLCLVLSSGAETNRYLNLHMGMTGRIHVQGAIAENWGGRKKLGGVGGKADENTFPPAYTHLIFKAGDYTACFCDPRKFGSCNLASDLAQTDALAPDALTCLDAETIRTRILPTLTNQRLGVKALLLDQKRCVSGVGNWVADEVLYQCELHPEQKNLTEEEAKDLLERLQRIVAVATDALKNNTHYPQTWLFGYRWTKKKATKDAVGRKITFVTSSSGRTTAIVASIQKLRSRSKVPSESSSGQELQQSPRIEPDQSLGQKPEDSPSLAPNPRLIPAVDTSPKETRKRKIADLQKYRHVERRTSPRFLNSL